MTTMYIVTTVVGQRYLVEGSSTEDVEREWSESVEARDAEPIIAGLTRPATRQEVLRYVGSMHDYR